MTLESVSLTVAWTLLHSLWQAAAVGTLLAFALRLRVLQAPSRRYAACVAALGAVVVLAVATAGWRPALGLAGGATLLASRPWLPVGDIDAERLVRLAGAAGRAGFVVAGIWLIGVAALLVQYMLRWRLIGRLHRAAPATGEIVLRAGGLASRLGVTGRVEVLEAREVSSPLVIGWRQPRVIVPPDVRTALDPAQMDAILAHEMAHVRRRDFPVNLGQNVLDQIFFFNPAVRWISRQMRVERERCCDDLAVAACGDRVLYARALLRLEQLRATGAAGAPAASDGSLVERVARLLGGREAGVRRDRPPLAPAAAILLVLVCAPVAATVEHASVVGRLAGGLGHESARERLARTRALGRLGGTLVVGPLVERLTADGSEEVRAGAADALECLRSPRAFDALHAATADPSARVRERAVQALDALEDPRALDALVLALADRSSSVREEAAEALGELRDPRGVEPLVQALGDRAARVRREAADALGSIGDGRAVAPLSALLADDECDVRREARRALRDLQRRLQL